MMHDMMSCGAGESCGMMAHMYYFYLWPTIIGILFIVATVYIIYWLFANEKGLSLRKETPLDILKARYARGDISKKQFDAMKRELE